MTDTETVRAMLARAGLAPSEDEIAGFIKRYAGQQAGIESLYAVAAARYESPGLHFTATPVFAEWSS